MNIPDVPRKPVLLVILDGVGCNPAKENNALVEANTPNLDRYFSSYPFTTIQASGQYVGLPVGQMGNSEVGHMTIGSGNILLQDLVRIDHEIETESFYHNLALLDAVNEAKRKNRPLHLLGLVSDGGVHSHIRHCIALIKLCEQHGVAPMLHMITDGRDTPPKSALKFLDMLVPYLERANGQIATISGRFYAMDRDKRWERTQLAWRNMCFCEGKMFTSAAEAINTAYDSGQTDEFIEPCCIEGGVSVASYDQVVFFNFRNDRTRQLTYVLAGKDFKPFDRQEFQPVDLTCLTEYDPQLNLAVAFPPEFPETTLAEVISQHNIRQLHCAETEKYAHVTFFFNGGREACFPGEERQMIPSPNVKTYDLAPEMAAKQVTDEVIQGIESQRFGFIVVNYANGDMVGHTAVHDAVIHAVETLDVEVDRLIQSAINNGYSILLTADHGNCDEMVDAKTGQPHTQHTTHPVPLLLIDEENWRLKPNMGLSNIAATVLELMGIEKPERIQCESMLQKL